jgi:hypothetical protein
MVIEYTISNGQPIDINRIDPMVKDMILELRKSIPDITKGTMLKKVIPIDDLDNYVNGYYTPQGFVSRVADTGESLSSSMTSSEVININRLDYSGTKFFSNKGYAVIEFATDDYLDIKVPSKISDFPGGKYLNEKPPFSGTGFIANTSGKLIPEYYIEPKSVNFLDGAEIYEFSSDGTGKLVAVYKYDEGWVTL